MAFRVSTTVTWSSELPLDYFHRSLQGASNKPHDAKTLAKPKRTQNEADHRTNPRVSVVRTGLGIDHTTIILMR